MVVPRRPRRPPYHRSQSRNLTDVVSVGLVSAHDRRDDQDRSGSGRPRVQHADAADPRWLPCSLLTLLSAALRWPVRGVRVVRSSSNTVPVGPPTDFQQIGTVWHRWASCGGGCANTSLTALVAVSRACRWLSECGELGHGSSLALADEVSTSDDFDRGAMDSFCVGAPSACAVRSVAAQQLEIRAFAEAGSTWRRAPMCAQVGLLSVAVYERSFTAAPSLRGGAMLGFGRRASARFFCVHRRVLVSRGQCGTDQARVVAKHGGSRLATMPP